MVCAPARATISRVDIPIAPNTSLCSAPVRLSPGILPSGSALSASILPRGTSMTGPPVISTAYAPAAAMQSANDSPAAGPSLVASYTAVTGPRPRLRPNDSGRDSSYLTEAFMPPSLVAVLNVPASWNTRRSTAGALVLTMFASSAALSAARASGVSTRDEAATAGGGPATSAASGVVASKDAANTRASRRVVAGALVGWSREADARQAGSHSRW
mmetsp:Transcript_1900/g.7148  ORF Transcript_1900/g.7148 Transcript_1900/m.7148 type:complete len:215 (+) Transcript_1900:2130-2774(+)